MAVYTLVAYTDEIPFDPEKSGTIYRSASEAFSKASELFTRHVVDGVPMFGDILHRIEVHRDGVMIYALINHD